MHATAAIISLTACDLIHPRQQRLPGQLLVADPDCRHARAPSGGTPSSPGRLTLPGPWAALPTAAFSGAIPMARSPWFSVPCRTGGAVAPGLHARGRGCPAGLERRGGLHHRHTGADHQDRPRGRTFTLPPAACRWLAAATRVVPHHEAWLGLPWPGRAASQRARRPGGHHQAGVEARDRRGEQPLIAPLCPHRCPSATSRIPRV